MILSERNAMPEVTNVDDVKSVLHELEDNNPDLFYDLPYSGTGLLVDDDEEGLPDGWSIFTHEVHTDRMYDSYGNGYTEDGFVILRVTNGTDEQLYRLPVNYASFQGWDVDVRKLSKTQQVEKVVKTCCRNDPRAGY
jgi:hypothetical protein